MKYKNLLDMLIPRVERLGLIDTSTGRADAAELELYLYQSLLDILDAFDFEAYTIIDDNMAITQAGTRNYALPTRFGRLIYPRVMGKRGIFLQDVTDAEAFDLEFVDPNTFMKRPSLANRRPTHFTISQRQLYLYPTPDAAAGGSAYTVIGAYIERVERPEPDDDVILPNPAALIHNTIYLIASDTGKLNNILIQQRNESLQNLLASQTRNVHLMSLGRKG